MINDIYQEIFNTAYFGMAAQGFKQSLSKDFPRYRGDKSRRCVVGNLIPDHLYSEEMENLGVAQLFENFPNLPYAGNSEILEFLSSMQSIHDTCDFPHDMQYELDCLARQYL